MQNSKLLDEIKEMGVKIAFVTLHVGLGTFRPVKVDDVTNHKMHKEEYFMSKEVAEKLNKFIKIHYARRFMQHHVVVKKL